MTHTPPTAARDLPGVGADADADADAGTGAGAAARWATPAAVGRAATLALYDELALQPKPGLVSFADSGSHDDMDAHTFMRSLLALRHSFVQMAALGAHHAPFSALQACGIAAEQRMLAATGGVNTHRGAVFTLGLLCAAAGAWRATPRPGDGRTDPAAQGLAVAPPPALADALRTHLRLHWGAALQNHARRRSGLPGGRAAERHGLRSAAQEAALGLPALFGLALPAWRRAQAAGLAGQRLKLQVFFTLLAELDDCNIAHRGGLDGLRFARQQARAFLAQGGAAHPLALARAQAVHQAFVARRLSPGGCADLLAAACLVQRLAALGTGGRTMRDQ